jgi:hypothetical protein
MSGLVCLDCRKFLRVKKNGVVIEEGMPNGSGGWQSYKLWHGDLYECPDCGFQLVTGFGHKPLAEHYESTYAVARERYQPIARVDDCGGARP